MEIYRKKLTIETICLTIISLALLAVQILAFARIITPITGGDWADFWNGLVAGMACGVMVLFIVGIVTNILAIRSEKRLKKLYAKEHDERTQQIVIRAQSFGMRMGTVAMLAAVIVLGYFDVGMSLACLGCTVAQSVITVISKIYWSRVL